jgi:hypothetical protein
MRKFEYYMLTIDGMSPKYYGYVEELNNWGKLGWEVCGFNSNDKGRVVFFLKREIVSL